MTFPTAPGFPNQYPQAPQGAQPPVQNWGAPPQGFAPPPQTSSPQGFGPPPQAPAQPPQGFGVAPQGFGQPPAGYAPPVATTAGAQGFGPGAAATAPVQGNPLAGVTETGGRLPMILQTADVLLEYRDHKLLAQSNTTVFNFMIIESTNPNYAPGLEIQMIQKLQEVPGHWKWNKGAGVILGMVRCLMGYADEASFRAVPGADDFVMACIRGQKLEPNPLAGRRARCTVSPTGKVDKVRNQPFMQNTFRPA